MSHIPPSLEKIIEKLSKFPGIGKKTAQRLGLYILKASSDEIYSLAQSLCDVKDKIKKCEICHNISETSPCGICADPRRDNKILCIIEDSSDILLLEKTGYNGHYHVLDGVISPLDGIEPEDIHLDDLLEKSDNYAELIIATNAGIEGDTTSLYIQKLLSEKNVNISRLARGIPVGGNLEYVDELTLLRSMSERVEIKT